MKSYLAALVSATAVLFSVDAIANMPPALYTAASVTQALRLPDGSLILAGNFTTVGEVARAGLAKLNAAGQLDATWNPAGLLPNTAGQIVALAASPDGSQLYIATADHVQDVYTTGVGANVAGFSVTATGTVDGGNSGIRTIAVDANGYIYIAGAFANIDSQSRNGLARVDSASTLDAGWKPSSNSTVTTLAVDSAGGLIYLGGAFVNVGGATHLRIARAQLSDGSIDATWTPSVSSTSDGVHHLALSADGSNVILVGNFTAVNSTARSGLAMISAATGANDPSWNPPTLTGYSVDSIVAASDYVYLGGDLFCCNQVPLARVAATGAGTIDATWTPAASGRVRALVPDGAAVDAFGDFAYMGNTPVLSAAQLLTDGSATHALPDCERPGSAFATYTESSGAALLLGDFQKVDQTYRAAFFRLEPDASIDAAFVPPRFSGGGGLYPLLAVASDAATGQVYVGGYFTQADGVTRNSIARLDGTSGALDSSWTTSIDALPSTGSVQAIAVAADGVFVGGQFSHVNGASRANIAKLTPSGTLDPVFAGSTNGAVSRIALAGSNVYIGGTFLNPRDRIARISATDGSLDASWNPTFPWAVSWLDFFDLKRVGSNTIVSNQFSVGAFAGVVITGEIDQIDDSGQVAIVARFDQPVFNVLGARDGGSVYAAGTFYYQYAINDFLSQTAHPNGLVQVSLRTGTFGVDEAWAPVVPSASGIPSLTFLGSGPNGVLAGDITISYPTPRDDLFLLGLPLGDYLFKDGFE
jgi:hypothetical protein